MHCAKMHSYKNTDDGSPYLPPTSKLLLFLQIGTFVLSFLAVAFSAQAFQQLASAGSGSQLVVVGPCSFE